MAKTKAAKVHPDQGELPGAESDERIQPIINAARKYQRDRDARFALSKVEKESKDRLLTVMNEHGKQSYVFGGIAVFVDNKANVKVTNPAKPSENGDGEETEE